MGDGRGSCGFLLGLVEDYEQQLVGVASPKSPKITVSNTSDIIAAVTVLAEPEGGRYCIEYK